MPALIDVLKADPLKFLKAFRIKISTTGVSRVAERVHLGKKRDDLRFDSAMPNVDDPGSAEACRAHVVQAKHGAPDFYQLTNDCDLMITTQLSGCCMILDGSAATPRIAHVWPHSNASCPCRSGDTNYQSGGEVQDALARDYPECKLYGIRDYIQTYSYVIGVNMGRWRFFAQERPNDGRISKAAEIFI